MNTLSNNNINDNGHSSSLSSYTEGSGTLTSRTLGMMTNTSNRPTTTTTAGIPLPDSNVLTTVPSSNTMHTPVALAPSSAKSSVYSADKEVIVPTATVFETWITVKTRTTEKSSNRANNSNSSSVLHKRIWAFPATNKGVYLGKTYSATNGSNSSDGSSSSSSSTTASLVSTAGNLFRSTAKLFIGGSASSPDTNSSSLSNASSLVSGDNIVLEDNCGIPDEALLSEHAHISLAPNLYDIQLITQGRTYMLIGQGNRYPKLPPQPLQLEMILKMGACSVMITDLATKPRPRVYRQQTLGAGATSDQSCYICFDETSTEDNALEPSPCTCSKLVHRQCLTRWVATKGSRFCSICKGRLPIDTAVNPPYLVLQVIRHMRGIPWTAEREYIVSFQGREPQSITVGCSTDCDLVIPDPSLSRIHARISYKNSTFYLEDLGSSAGTYIKVPVNTPITLSSDFSSSLLSSSSGSLLGSTKSLMTTFKMGRTMVTVKIKRKRHHHHHHGLLSPWIRKSIHPDSAPDPNNKLPTEMMTTTTTTNIPSTTTEPSPSSSSSSYTTARPFIDTNHRSVVPAVVPVVNPHSSREISTIPSYTSSTKNDSPSGSSNTLNSTVLSPRSPTFSRGVSVVPSTVFNPSASASNNHRNQFTVLSTMSSDMLPFASSSSSLPIPIPNSITTTVITSHNLSTSSTNNNGSVSSIPTQNNLKHEGKNNENEEQYRNAKDNNAEEEEDATIPDILANAYRTLCDQITQQPGHHPVSYGVPIPLHLLASGKLLQEDDDEDDEVEDHDD